ncbi:MAG: hypothetical protein QNJ88_13525 [Acidimicrobiia bacterium]|nr:hypothetical protein [Acidimicrobiia bacterium]
MTDRLPELPRIEVDRDIAAAAEMPDDLDANVFGPYAVPDPARRRRAGFVYLAGAVIVAAGIGFGLPSGMWLMVAALLVITAYHQVAGVHLAVREADALTAANQTTDFPVGHASAQLGFEGWRARPIWNVLVFSADDPPSQRGLVRVDARSGEVVDQYSEAI